MHENNQPSPGEETVPEREFSTIEAVFAWLCVVLGYLFCRAVPVSAQPMGGFLFVVLLFAVTVIVLRRKGAEFGVASWCAAGSAVVMSAALIMSASPFLQTLSYAYALAAYFIFVYTACGNGRCGFSERCVIEWCKALLIPFYALARLPAALFSHRMKNGGKVLAKIFVGAAIAVVPTMIVVGLLSYDEAFSSILMKFFMFDFSDIVSHVFSIAFGFPVGMVIFGACMASGEHCGEDLLDEETCRKAAASMRTVSAVSVTAAAVPLLVVYGVFFFSQSPYYLSGFTGVLPDGFSYAEYAREGFFQLCTVSVINLIVILAAVLFMKRRDERPPVILRLLTLLYSLCTLVLITTAVSKMLLYIDTYGLTQKRVYATWFMMVLAVVFVLAVLKMFLPRIKAVLLASLIVVGCFAVLALSNVDGLIAAYNVERYLDGTLETVDVEMMEELGDAAIPSLVALHETLEDAKGTSEKMLYRQVNEILLERATTMKEDSGYFALTIPAVVAENALRDIGML